MRKLHSIPAVFGVLIMSLGAQDHQWLERRAPQNVEEYERAEGWQKSLAPDGSLRLLVPSQNPAGVKIPASKIRWAREIPMGAFTALKSAVSLIGDLDAMPVAIEEIGPAGRPIPLLPIATGLEMREHWEWTAFGIEERVEKNDAVVPVWTVKAGSKPAGIYGARLWRLPKLPSSGSWSVELTLEGEGSVEVGVGVRKGREFADPKTLKKVELSTEGAKVRLPCPFSAGAEVRLSVLSRGSAAKLSISSVVWSEGGSARTSEPLLPRGVWNWSAKPAEWTAMESRWKEAGIKILQLALPRVMDHAARQALADLRAKNFRVVAVEGDPQMILPSEHQIAATRSRELAEGRGHWLDALQYDVEPYLLPGFRLEDVNWQRQWTSLFDSIQKGSKMPTEAVVPYWLIDTEGGRAVLEKLSKSASRIVVMNYRSDPVEFSSRAMQWLEWSAETRCPVSIAAECGPIPDLQQFVFREAESGPLWVSEWKGIGGVAVLFEGPVPRSEAGRVFALERQSKVPGNRTTLRGRPEALSQIERLLAKVAASAGLPEKLQPIFLIHEPSEDDLKALPGNP